MAWQGNDVLGLKNFRLLENLAANFGKRESVRRGVELFQPARILNRLQRHSSHARLLQSVFDGLADLVIVESLAQGHHQRGGNIVAIEPFQRLFADATQIAATERSEEHTSELQSPCN